MVTDVAVALIATVEAPVKVCFHYLPCKGVSQTCRCVKSVLIILSASDPMHVHNSGCFKNTT